MTTMRKLNVLQIRDTQHGDYWPEVVLFASAEDMQREVDSLKTMMPGRYEMQATSELVQGVS